MSVREKVKETSERGRGRKWVMGWEWLIHMGMGNKEMDETGKGKGNR